MDLKQEQHSDSQEEMQRADKQLTIKQLSEQLQQLSDRLTHLEQRTSRLEAPQLMYKRPKSETHEKIAETLDYLHNSVEELLHGTTTD